MRRGDGQKFLPTGAQLKEYYLCEIIFVFDQLGDGHAGDDTVKVIAIDPFILLTSSMGRNNKLCVGGGRTT